MIAVDGAASMIELARARLGSLAERVDFRIGDLRALKDVVPGTAAMKAVFSSYALHHLSAGKKPTWRGGSRSYSRQAGGL